MKRVTMETITGAFVLVGIICIGYLTIRYGKMEIVGENTYEIIGRFESVTGLKTGASIELAGVQVGQVSRIRLDEEQQRALVTMKIQKDLVLTDDVIASIKTAGLIGDKYIKLSPGGSDELLKPGDMITETESALDLEELISKYVFGKL
ncbi:MAG: outer membrane lipid asymmetry maintenance protein MlaD [Thermodesulfobacteriota bacterium]